MGRFRFLLLLVFLALVNCLATLQGGVPRQRNEGVFRPLETQAP
jgi:hypothetical protein